MKTFCSKLACDGNEKKYFVEVILIINYTVHIYYKLLICITCFILSFDRLSIREFVPGQLWTSSNTPSDEQILSANYNTNLVSRDGVVDHDWLAQDNDSDYVSGSVWIPTGQLLPHQITK